MKEPKLFYRRSDAPLSPPKSADVRCATWARWRISWELYAYFQGNMSFSEYLCFRVAFVALPIVVASLSLAFLIWAGIADISLSHWTLSMRVACSVAAGLATLGFVSLIFRIRMGGVDTPHYEFDAHHAAEISRKSAEILERQLSGNALCAINKLKESAGEPYLILRGIAPVRADFPIKPEKTRIRSVDERKTGAIKRWTRIIDATAGGLLNLLGAEAAPRFADDAADEKLVIDKYTRVDVQELPDMQQDDVFLRFHQSTIERPFKRTCRYKTYTAISNFRRKPIYLLRVRDVIDCLENKDGKYTEEDHKEIFWNSPNLDKNNVVRVLMDDKYQRQPPRAIRFLKGDDKEVGRRIIRVENGDYIMAFDPARVWIHSSGSSLHAEAILALRWAIHLTSRTELREIALRSRDVLIVDNRRSMVARREDAPYVSWRDIFVTLIAKLPIGLDFSGWWLRVVFGYPREGADLDEVAGKRTGLEGGS